MQKDLHSAVPQSTARELQFTPEGERLLTRQGNGTVRVWPVP